MMIDLDIGFLNRVSSSHGTTAVDDILFSLKLKLSNCLPIATYPAFSEIGHFSQAYTFITFYEVCSYI